MSQTARTIALFLLASAGLSIASLNAQPASEPTPPPRPTEGSVIVNLPSADVAREGTLSLLFTHRFSQPLADSDIHSLYSFDSGADIGIGLSYTPISGLDVGLYRSSNLDVYEVSAKYQVITRSPFHLTARGGGDFRTERGLDRIPGYERNGYFAQAIFALDLGSRLRFTAVPTYVSKSSGQAATTLAPSAKDIFTVPAAVSLKVLRTVNIQAEVYPALSKTESVGVGWITSIEKTVPGHRFAFTVGNVRATTVDQYVRSVPPPARARDYYIGFNLVRQWKLK